MTHLLPQQEPVFHRLPVVDTAYLTNGCHLEVAQQMAGHEPPGFTNAAGMTFPNLQDAPYGLD
jgi:hypothetical protein